MHLINNECFHASNSEEFIFLEQHNGKKFTKHSDFSLELPIQK